MSESKTPRERVVEFLSKLDKNITPYEDNADALEEAAKFSLRLADELEEVSKMHEASCNSAREYWQMVEAFAEQNEKLRKTLSDITAVISLEAQKNPSPKLGQTNWPLVVSWEKTPWHFQKMTCARNVIFPAGKMPTPQLALLQSRPISGEVLARLVEVRRYAPNSVAVNQAYCAAEDELDRTAPMP